jgi:hypothetical protein
MLATIQSRTFYYLLLPRNVKIRIYKILILPVVLCECESWSRILREEHRLRVFENGIEENIRMKER